MRSAWNELPDHLHCLAGYHLSQRFLRFCIQKIRHFERDIPVFGSRQIPRFGNRFINVCPQDRSGDRVLGRGRTKGMRAWKLRGIFDETAICNDLLIESVFRKRGSRENRHANDTEKSQTPCWVINVAVNAISVEATLTRVSSHQINQASDNSTRTPDQNKRPEYWVKILINPTVQIKEDKNTPEPN